MIIMLLGMTLLMKWKKTMMIGWCYKIFIEELVSILETALIDCEVEAVAFYEEQYQKSKDLSKE